MGTARSGCASTAASMVVMLLAGMSLVACTSDDAAPGSADGSLPEIVDTTTSTVAVTTTQPASAESVAVRAAVAAYWAASQACGQRPAACDPASFTAAAGSLRGVAVSYRAQLITNGYYLGQPEGDSDAYVSVRSVTLDPARTSAITDECVFEPTPLFGPTGADGQPLVINDFAATQHVVHTFVLEAGVWRASEEQHPDVASDAVPCGDVPEAAPTDPTEPA